MFRTPQAAWALEVLLDAGCDKEYRATNGTTPLFQAAFQGDLECVQILLRHGASTQARSNGKCLPIHNAIKREHWEIAELLIPKGISGPFVHPHTPTHEAFEEIVKAGDSETDTGKRLLRIHSVISGRSFL